MNLYGFWETIVQTSSIRPFLIVSFSPMDTLCFFSQVWRTLFCNTPAGYLFSRIVQCVCRESENAEKELYSLLYERLKVEEDSQLVFGSKFIKKMYEKGLFGNYILIFRKVLESKDVADIESFAKLMQQSLSVGFQIRLFVNVWEETINELEPDDRRLYMYDQKLAIDTRMGAKAVSREYQKLRLELSGETERVALEGFCSECQRRYCISDANHRIY